MKVALLTQFRNASQYLKEFVEHYKSLGIDKIFLGDNASVDSSKVSEVLKDYISSGLVQLDKIDKPLTSQRYYWNDIYQSHKTEYDWFLCFDDDEYMIIPETNNDLKAFLSQEKFNNTDIIKIGWQVMDDNGKIHYEDKPLMERFTHVCELPTASHESSKSIVHNSVAKINGLHDMTEPKNYSNYNRVNVNGEFQQKGLFITHYYGCWFTAYIRHFRYKSVDEYLDKISRGYTRDGGRTIIDWYNIKLDEYGNPTNRELLNKYFKVNEDTEEKRSYLSTKLDEMYQEAIKNKVDKTSI